MAQWRPLHRRITQSEKILALGTNDTARWIYCALLPYTDREGRINANPMGLAGTILEGFPYTPADIEGALEALARVGLVTLYRTERHQFLVQFTNFELSRPHAKEPESELPGPEDSGTQLIDPSGSGSGGPPQATPDNSGKVPGNSPAKPAEVIPETPETFTDPDVHVHVHVQRDVHKELSSESKASDPTPQTGPVEPVARRELAKPTALKKPLNLQSYARQHPTLAELVNTWHEHRGPLPAWERITPERHRKLTRLIEQCGGSTGATERLRDATLQVSQDEFWIRKGFGLDNLLTEDKVQVRSEQFRQGGGMSEGDRKLAATAAKVARAIGGPT